MIIRVFDIETVPDFSIWAPPADKPDAFPPPLVHQVVAISYIDLDGTAKEKGASKFEVVDSYSGAGADMVGERHLLEAFGSSCLEPEALMLVSWNGRRFDGPVLATRAMKHAIPWGWWHRHDPSFRYRYSEAFGHVDLMDVLADFGSAMPMKMGDVARLCGMPGKGGMDGSMVKDEIEKGNLEKVSKYCLLDVVQTTGIYVRHQYQKGLIDKNNVNLIFNQLEDLFNDGCNKEEKISLGRI